MSAALPENLDLVASCDAAQALERVAATSFAIVIADLDSPRIDGLTFLVAVKERSPSTVCLALTRSAPGVAPDVVFDALVKGQAPGTLRQVLAAAARQHVLLASAPAVSEPVASARSGCHPSAVERLALDLSGRHVELSEGTTLVGRSRACHLAIGDPRVSRRHMSFSYEHGQLAVKNLSKTNRVLVNGGALARGESCLLRVGDRVKLGSHEIRVCVVRDGQSSLEPTVRQSLITLAAPAPASALATLVEVADKYFLLGQSREAELVSRPALEALLADCARGVVPAAGDVELAGDLALRIADAKASGEWVDYVFDLHSAIGAPLAPAVIDRLHATIPGIASISIASYRGYVQTLVGQLDRFGPAERFLVRRIQGLESRIMMSAHV
jgi:CheY-like chemotaxis protein